jgi:mono/diheme cytochrome c family protein
MRELRLAPLVIALALPAAAADLGAPGDWADRGPGLGVEATADEVARDAISIPPDGAGLPPGEGSVAEGAEIYARACLACHGEAGAGGEGLVVLTGGVGSLTTDKPARTVSSYWPFATTLFDYIRRAMPLDAPQSLTDEEVYAVTAYVLSVDGIVPEDAVLDAASLPAVEMPNRDGFVPWWPEPER